MFELSIKDSIAAAHFIPGHQGMCKNLHGHTWKIEVVIAAETLDNLGMVADFIDIKKKLKSFLSVLDHVCLNDLPYFKEHTPTTENLAKYIYQNFAKDVMPLTLKRVQVWESDAASITYFE